MTERRKYAVTGAAGYTGKYITRRLLQEGHTVISLTGSPGRRDPFGGRVKAHAFHFDEPAALSASLEGVDTLFNTYWVRFNRGQSTYEKAVENTSKLLDGARAAGVRRLVHVSISKADSESELPYFRGKAQIEKEIKDSGLSHAILRPTVIFGEEDILINNIAWVLRRFPVFPVAGDGQYRLQPIHVEDLAEAAVAAAGQAQNAIIEAIGPETFPYDQLVRMLAEALGITPRLVHLPARLVYAGAQLMGFTLRDVFLTWDEIRGLLGEMLYTPGAVAVGGRALSRWAVEHREQLGRRYANELQRHYGG